MIFGGVDYMIPTYKKRVMPVIMLLLIVILSNPIAISVEKSNGHGYEITGDSSRTHVVSLKGKCESFGFSVFCLRLGWFWCLLPTQSLTFRIEQDLELTIDGVPLNLEPSVLVGFYGFKGFAPSSFWWSFISRNNDDQYVPIRVNGICSSIWIDQ
jgi:hypothetical protein